MYRKPIPITDERLTEIERKLERGDYIEPGNEYNYIVDEALEDLQDAVAEIRRRQGEHSVYAVLSVEENEFGDSREYAVFSEREIAERYASVLQSPSPVDDRMKVVEWSVNAWAAELRAGLVPWHIVLFKDGTIKTAERGYHWQAVQYSRPWFPIGGHYPKEPVMIMRLAPWTLALEEAIEIAQAERKRIIAAGEWPEDGTK